MPGRVIEHDRQPSAGEVITPQPDPRVQAGRDLPGRDPGRLQRAGQLVGGIDRPLSGCMAVQRQEDLAVRDRGASWWAACTANAVLPIPIIPLSRGCARRRRNSPHPPPWLPVAPVRTRGQ